MNSVGRSAVALLAAISLSPAVAPAAEMVVRGEVVEVVPLSDSGAADGAGDCHPPKPSAGADLVRLLEWDLRTGCRPTARATTGYRVVYRWDGRTYSRVMREPPGDTVSLRVRIR